MRTAAAMVTIRAQRSDWCRRIANDSIKKEISRPVLISRRSGAEFGSGNCIMSGPFPEVSMHIGSRGIIWITLIACALDTAHVSGSGVRPQNRPDPAHSKLELSGPFHNYGDAPRAPRRPGSPTRLPRWGPRPPRKARGGRIRAPNANAEPVRPAAEWS